MTTIIGKKGEYRPDTADVWHPSFIAKSKPRELNVDVYN